MPAGYYAEELDPTVRSRRGIPGMDTFESERRAVPRQPIPVGDIAEVPMTRRDAARFGVASEARGAGTLYATPQGNVAPSADLAYAERAAQARTAAAKAAGAGVADIAAAPAAGPVARAAGVAGTIGRGVAALANPLSPAGLALTAAGAITPLAKAGRERGAGRDFNNPNAGNPEAGDLRPGQLGEVRANALQQARGEQLRAAYADPSLAAQDIGSFNTGVQQRANQVAVANTPLPPNTPGAVVNGRQPFSDARFDGNAAAQIPGNEAVPGAVAPIDRSLQTTTQPVARAPGERSAAEIELAALGIERQNSALRLQQDAYGPGARNPDGTGGAAFIGSDIAAKNRATDIASLRNDAKLASGTRQRELLNAAQQAEGNTDQRAIARDRNAADVARNAAGEATQRRGQDLQATVAREGQRGARDIAEVQGNTQRDVAGLNSDSRVAAAETRAATPKFTPIALADSLAPDGLTVLKGGQVLLNNQTGEIVKPSAGGEQKKLSEADAITQAKAAIAKGADKAAVNKRLQEAGYKPL